MWTFESIFYLNFPNSNTPAMDNMIFFHENCLFVIYFVLLVVIFFLLVKSMSFESSVIKIENSFFEMSWTLLPSLIILLLVVPSLEVLYFSDSKGCLFFKKKIKVIAHQWYWEYEYMKKKTSKEMNLYDSYMMEKNNLSVGDFRNSEVDLPLVLTSTTPSRLIFTSADTIHSFYVPDFGVKVDCVPGRLNYSILFPNFPGLFYGYCAELCGVNHSFMPIKIEVLNV